jgi:hypothetical protein
MAGIISLLDNTRQSLAGMVTARYGTHQSPAPDKLQQPCFGIAE